MINLFNHISFSGVCTQKHPQSIPEFQKEVWNLINWGFNLPLCISTSVLLFSLNILTELFNVWAGCWFEHAAYFQWFRTLVWQRFYQELSHHHVPSPQFSAAVGYKQAAGLHCPGKQHFWQFSRVIHTQWSGNKALREVEKGKQYQEN